MHAWSLTAQVGKKASKSEKYGVRYITEEKEMKRRKEEAVSAQKVGLLKTAKRTRSVLLSSSLLSWKV